MVQPGDTDLHSGVDQMPAERGCKTLAHAVRATAPFFGAVGDLTQYRGGTRPEVSSGAESLSPKRLLWRRLL